MIDRQKEIADLLQIWKDAQIKVIAVQQEYDNYQVAINAETNGAQKDIMIAFRDNDIGTRLAQAKNAASVAEKNYQSAKESLYSPGEQQALVVQAQSQAAIAQKESENKIFMQKNTQYLIIGTVAVTVIGIVIWFVGRKTGA